MTRTRGRLAAAAGLLLFIAGGAAGRSGTEGRRGPAAWPAVVRHAAAPPAAHTGGFGEPTCQACHTGLPLNDPGGTLAVSVPERGALAGSTYRITVRLEGDIYTRRAGFQGALRWADGKRSGRSAGRVRPLGADVAITESPEGVAYVHQTLSGSDASSGAVEWSFEWTAPPEVGQVALHVAANAANGDDSPLDDLIYTAYRLIEVREAP